MGKSEKVSRNKSTGFFTFSILPFFTLSEANPRFACLMTFLAQNRAPDFRLKWHLVVFSAIIADDFKARWRIFALRRFFRATFRASLRRHHIALIKCFLFFFGKNKSFFTLHTRNFYVRHLLISPFAKFFAGDFRNCIIKSI